MTEANKSKDIQQGDADLQALRSIAALPILLLHVHEHCNCRCLMCDIWQKTDGKELDLKDFERHRESIVRLGVQEVVLTGGEALLHRGRAPVDREGNRGRAGAEAGHADQRSLDGPEGQPPCDSANCGRSKGDRARFDLVSGHRFDVTGVQSRSGLADREAG